MQAVISDQHDVFSQFWPLVHHGPKSNEPSTHDAPEDPFTVFIVEASVPLARLLATGLTTGCSSVEVSNDLDAGLQKFACLNSDLLIIDLDLPNLAAPALLRRIRAQRPEVQVLALSARDGIADLVSALDNGADDYLSKPFSLLELMARMRALRRRSKAVTQRQTPKCASLVLHHEQCRAERDGRFIDLTPREFSLLEYLVENPGKTLSRSVLTQAVWNMPVEGNTNIVDVYIKYLRDKLDGDHEVKLIRTVRGMGYSYQGTGLIA